MKLAPVPLPPLILTESTVSTSKFWGSTNISLTLPLTTGCILALTPAPAAIVIDGKLSTS